MNAINMMIPTLESSSRRRDSSIARVQPKPHRNLMPTSQSDDDNDDTNDNDTRTMAQPSINIGGVEYGNDEGFTTPSIPHHDHHIIHIRNLTLLPEFPTLKLPNNDRSSPSTSKHMTSLKPRIRRRSISIKEKRTLLARR